MATILQFPCWCGKKARVNGLCSNHHKGFLAIRRKMVDDRRAPDNLPSSTRFSRKQAEMRKKAA